MTAARPAVPEPPRSAREFTAASAGARRICFVAPHNYPVLAQRADLVHIGGAEIQRALLARELVRRGWQVSFVVDDHGQADGLELDGVRIFRIDARAGPSWLPGRLRRWHAFWSALERANADIYYQRTAGTETAQVAAWCRTRGRTFVYGVANEPECDWRLGGARPLHERGLYCAGLHAAHAIIAQTHAQRVLLQRSFGLQAKVVANCIANFDPRPHESATRLANPRVLWVGRLRPHKRPDWISLLADRCPQLQFDVVGAGPPRCAFVRATEVALRQRANVTLHGYRPHAEVAAFYARAAALVLTSAWEGYPNVFLEAWARGVPTIATLDPEGAITRCGLGAVASTPDGLAVALAALLEDPNAWAACAARCITYVRRAHSVEASTDAFVRALASAHAARRQRGGRRGETEAPGPTGPGAVAGRRSAP